MMANGNLSSQALLSQHGEMTSFHYGNYHIRFRTLKRPIVLWKRCTSMLATAD